MSDVIVVTGGRQFTNHIRLAAILDSLIALDGDGEYRDFEIVVGDAKQGTDALAREYCQARGYAHRVIQTQWDLEGKAAGYRANEAKAALANIVIQFPGSDPLPYDLAEKATARGIDVIAVPDRDGDDVQPEAGRVIVLEDL